MPGGSEGMVVGRAMRQTVYRILSRGAKSKVSRRTATLELSCAAIATRVSKTFEAAVVAWSSAVVGPSAMTRRFPFPPYPNGWFAIGFSADFKPGQVVTRHYFGQDIVIYRTLGGELRAAESHCPHLGA